MSTTPELRLRLPGTWHRVDVSSSTAAFISGRRLATSLFGTGTETAPVRRQLEREVRELERSSVASGVRALFVASQLRAGVVLPATLMILEPPALRLSPAVGTAPQVVSTALRQALVDASVDGSAEAVELDFGRFRALRIARIDSHAWDASGAAGVSRGGALRARYPAAFGAPARSLARTLHQRHLRADYWCTVPDSKRVLVVACSTSLGDIASSMLRLFDSILRSGHYVWI